MDARRMATAPGQLAARGVNPKSSAPQARYTPVRRAKAVKGDTAEPARMTGGGGGEGINRRACQDDGERSLRHQQSFQGAILPRFLDAGIESGKRHAQVIEKREAHQRERKVIAAAGHRAGEFRTFDEARQIVKRGHAEKSFESFQQQRSAIAAGDREIAREEGGNLPQSAP